MSDARETDARETDARRTHARETDLRGSVIESYVQGEASAEPARASRAGAIERATSSTSTTHVVVERVFTRRR